MKRIRQWLRSWLGIEQLDQFVKLMREELDLPEGITSIQEVTTDKPITIRKGYDKILN